MNLSKNVLNMLTDFLINEIGSKSLNGITYALLIKGKDNKKIARYLKIREEASKCGIGDREVFRVYELSNGFIFDIDMDIVKAITTELIKSVNKTNGNLTGQSVIGNHPEKRRVNDMEALAKLIIAKNKSGSNNIEVALFSRNSTHKIVITGVGKRNEMLNIYYNAYCIRPEDIEEINEKYLIPQGIRASGVELSEILPTRTGVRADIHIERC